MSNDRRTEEGRSPRVRGSRRRSGGRRGRSGSIPACAGEPRERALRSSAWWVDPRVCGGAGEVLGDTRYGKGRSPRVRGSLTAVGEEERRAGSIPACAGEPRRREGRGGCGWVDPRVCGGATAQSPSPVCPGGRSPRVRGSLREDALAVLRAGSIPACAGEPAPVAAVSRSCRVDPRVCGGARGRREDAPQGSGRSPRVRGSPPLGRVPPQQPGSIPACAGEPPAAPAGRAGRRVDPRVCGGAAMISPWRTVSGGRSPRVRGSLDRLGRSETRRGSIPACAGEPASPPTGRSPCGVDPRVCGGAAKVTPEPESVTGRSPRVRGSHALANPRHDQRGSIPACAGEP